MAKLHQVGNTKVRVNANDHLPPHFHVASPDAEALVSLETIMVLRGDIDRSNGRTALAWAAVNRAALVAEWNRINPRFPTA